MASNSVVSPYYVLQSSFATGEISREVANRVDLDKYSAALTKAVNCLVRPYGPVYKRPGSKFCCETKYADKTCILVPFSSGEEVDYMLEIGDKYIRVHKQGEYLDVEVATPYEERHLSSLRFTQSADTMFIACGYYPLQILKRNAEKDWELKEYEIKKPYFDDSLGGGTEEATITPSAVSGSDITLTANEALFNGDMVGMSVQLKHDVASKTVSANVQPPDSQENDPGDYFSESMYCGESWKIITHGTWAGNIKVQYSEDDANWRDYRAYTSNSDYNATESGSLIEGKYLRFVGHITSGTCTVDLTRLSYLETGFATIKEYISSTEVKADVDSTKKFGDAAATKQWSFSVWSRAYGYPRTVCFFQDRLCLGGTLKQPYMLWMSRTGDYNNFSVEKADGKVTDDSAVALSFVSRKQFEILHLVPHTDLLIYTKGNEWILSGREVITPSNASPQMQTTRGCGNVEPIIIGNKAIFVQGRGSTVRDMGYSYETDNYGGADLTILDKQIVEGKDILDAAYMQEPNSAVYFVRDDGTIAVLVYVVDQKVYAWSSIVTDGFYEAVAAVTEGDYDTVYTVAIRGNKRYIEAFQGDIHTVVPNDYIMLDSAKVIESATKSGTFVVEHLAGKTVTVLADGREFKDIDVDAEGNLKLPTSVNKAVIGLPYTMVLELPNVEVKDRDGTMQGRKKIVSSVILRLHNSLGGMVGPDLNVLDAIHYDEYQAVENIQLYSGDKEMQVPMGGFNTDGRITIVSDEPYPFNLLALVRAVFLGG